MKYSPIDPAFVDRITESFNKQIVMRTIGAELLSVNPGKVSIKLKFREDLTQQKGFLHAGITTTIVDSACGYAALSLMSKDSDVVSVEFKVNLLAPAEGESFIAVGKIIKSGKTLSVVEGKVFAFKQNQKTLVATMLGTMMRIQI